MGSGQGLCDPALGFVRKMFWNNEQPNLNDGIFGTIWTLNQAIEMNTGGINGPIQLATMTNIGETKIFNLTECQEHIQYISEFEEYLRSFKNKLTDNPKEIPLYSSSSNKDD